MNRKIKALAKISAAGLLACTASIALADDAPSVGVIPKVGTLGAGADITFPVSESLNIRLGYGTYSDTKDQTESDVSYRADMKVGGATAVLDWYPFGGNFFLSGGAIKNNTKADLRNTGNFTYNGQTYTSAQASAAGSISFAKTAPYIGLGWGNASARSRFGFFAEVGATYQTAKVQITSSCNVPSCSNPDPGGSGLTIAQKLAADTQIEQADAQAEADKYNWYPVIQLGMSVRF